MAFGAKITALAFAVAVLMPSDAYTFPIYKSGDQLNDDCRALLSISRNSDNADSIAQAWSGGVCLGFVLGVMDVSSGLKELVTGDPQPPFCMDGVSPKAAAETVAIYLDEHPEERNNAAFLLVKMILADKFPC